MHPTKPKLSWKTRLFSVANLTVWLVLIALAAIVLQSMVPDRPITTKGLVILVAAAASITLVIRSTIPHPSIAIANSGRKSTTLVLDGAAARAAVARQRPTSAERSAVLEALTRNVQTPTAATCRHEAGHAVAAHVLGHEVFAVSVRGGTNQDGVSTSGRTIWAGPSAPGVDRIAVAMAGLISEGQPVYPDTPSQHDDYGMLSRLPSFFAITDPDGRTPGQILDAGCALARKIVTEHSAEIDVSAQALAGTNGERVITGAELAEILTQADQRHQSDDAAVDHEPLALDGDDQ